MPILIIVLALVLVATFVTWRSLAAGPAARPSTIAMDDADGTDDHTGIDGRASDMATDSPTVADVADVEMTLDQRVETGRIIDDWIALSAEPTAAKRAGEPAIIGRCETVLRGFGDDDLAGDAGAAAAALRSVLSMALFNQERYDDCIEVLRHQLVPVSLLDPAQRSVHPLPLLARALAARGDDLEALAVLHADEQLDDRRDPASAAAAASDREALRATIASRSADPS